MFLKVVMRFEMFPRHKMEVALTHLTSLDPASMCIYLQYGPYGTNVPTLNQTWRTKQLHYDFIQRRIK